MGSRQARRTAAPTDSTVLVTGETGTVKERIEAAARPAGGHRARRRDYRLNVFPIHAPALRKRREDIPALVRHLVLKYAARLGRTIDTIPAPTLEALAAYDWPGNIRELGNVIERSVIVSRGSTLELGDWIGAPTPRAGETAAPARPAGGNGHTLEERERAHILEALERTKWRVSGPKGAALLLGLKPTTLESRMKKLGIARPR